MDQYVYFVSYATNEGRGMGEVRLPRPVTSWDDIQDIVRVLHVDLGHPTATIVSYHLLSEPTRVAPDPDASHYSSGPLSATTPGHPTRLTLPSGYTLLAFAQDDVDYPLGEGWLRVSVYEPGSDCADRDERVAELYVPTEDADALTALATPWELRGRLS